MREPIRIDFYDADDQVRTTQPQRACLALVFWAPTRKWESSQPMSFIGPDRHQVEGKIQKFIDDGLEVDKSRKLAHQRMLATKARRANANA